jgi:hypothetical protein
MKNTRIGTILLAIVAVLAMSVVGTAAASATTSMPEIVNKEGKLPSKTGFKGASGASTFETKSGEAVKCKEDKVTGKLTGSSSDETSTSFTGCTAAAGLLKCKTKGAASGEIVLKVNSELVWLNKSEESEPGEDLVLPSELTIECTGLASETLKVKGSTLCPISGFKKLESKGTITCKQTKGVQEFTKYFLGGSEITDITETEGTGAKKFAFQQSGLTSTDSIEYEEAVEII